MHLVAMPQNEHLLELETIHDPEVFQYRQHRLRDSGLGMKLLLVNLPYQASNDGWAIPVPIVPI